MESVTSAEWTDSNSNRDLMASNELDGPPPESASSPVPVGATSGDVLLGVCAHRFSFTYVAFE